MTATPRPSSQPAADIQALVRELKEAMGSSLDALLAEDVDEAGKGFENTYERTRQLVLRKLEVKGAKSETRDLLGELLFSRMRRTMREFVRAPGGRSPEDCAQFVMATMFSSATLTEFASAFDRAILEMSAPREYSFAGMADFIAIEEVLQLIGSGKHSGCLTFEKPDNRIDLYVNYGHIAFMDVHRLVRRVLPGAGPMSYREIDDAVLQEAERVRAEEQIPLLLALHRAGVFGDLDMRQVMNSFAVEAFYEFLMEPEGVFFSYRRLPELPDHVLEHNLHLAVTPILLEGSKRLDEWRSMLKVFPDRFAPIDPYEDMYARMAGLNLAVVDIKLLALIDGEHSPKSIAESMGLPIFECYQHLVNLAKESVVPTPGGQDALGEVTMSVEDTMRAAFEALDANEDDAGEIDAVTGADGELSAGLAAAQSLLGDVLGDDAGAPAADAVSPSDGGIGAALGAVFGDEGESTGTARTPKAEEEEPKDDTCGLFDGDLGGGQLSLGGMFSNSKKNGSGPAARS